MASINWQTSMDIPEKFVKLPCQSESLTFSYCRFVACKYCYSAKTGYEEGAAELTGTVTCFQVHVELNELYGGDQEGFA